MKKSVVSSFDVDHRTLREGLYLRSTYTINDSLAVLSWDLRFCAPMDKQPLSAGVVHTIEHLMAHYLRQKLGNRVVSFAPMGCKTGFYLIVKGFTSQRKVMEAVAQVCEEQSALKDKSDVPGLTVEQCGNPELYDIEGSNAALKEYGALVRKLLNK